MYGKMKTETAESQVNFCNTSQISISVFFFKLSKSAELEKGKAV